MKKAFGLLIEGFFVANCDAVMRYLRMKSVEVADQIRNGSSIGRLNIFPDNIARRIPVRRVRCSPGQK